MAFISRPGEPPVVDQARLVDDAPQAPAEEPDEVVAAELPPPATAPDAEWVEIDPRVGEPLEGGHVTSIAGDGTDMSVHDVITVDGTTYLFARVVSADGTAELTTWTNRGEAEWRSLGPVERGSTTWSHAASDGSRVIIGGATADGDAAVWTSTDGDDWTREVVRESPAASGLMSYVAGVAASPQGRVVITTHTGVDLAWFRRQLAPRGSGFGTWFNDGFTRFEATGPFGLVIESMSLADMGADPRAVREALESPDDNSEAALQVHPTAPWEPVVPSDDRAVRLIAWDGARSVFYATEEALISADGHTWVRSAQLHTRRSDTWRGLSVADRNDGRLAVTGSHPGHAVEIDIDPIMGAVDRWFIAGTAAAEAGIGLVLGNFPGSAAAVPVDVTVGDATLTYDGRASELHVAVRGRSVTYPVNGRDAASTAIEVDADRLTAAFLDPDTGATLVEVGLDTLRALREAHTDQVFDSRWKAFMTADGDLWHEASVDDGGETPPTVHLRGEREALVFGRRAGDDPTAPVELTVTTFELPAVDLIPIVEPTGDELADLLERSYQNHPYSRDSRWDDFDVEASRASFPAERGEDIDESVRVVELLDVDGVPHMFTEQHGATPGESDVRVRRWEGTRWVDAGVALPAGATWSTVVAHGDEIVVGATSSTGDAIIRRSRAGSEWSEEVVAPAPGPLGLWQSVQAVATDGERTIVATRVVSPTSRWAPAPVTALGPDLPWRWVESQQLVVVPGPFDFPLASFTAAEAGLSAGVVDVLNGPRRPVELHLQGEPGAAFADLVVDGPIRFGDVDRDPVLDVFVLQDDNLNAWQSTDGVTWEQRDFSAGSRNGYWQDLSIRNSGGSLLTATSVDGEYRFRTDLTDLFGQAGGWRTDEVVVGHELVAAIASRADAAPAEAQPDAPHSIVVGDATVTVEPDYLVVTSPAGSLRVPIHGSTIFGDPSVVYDAGAGTATFVNTTTGVEVATVPLALLEALDAGRFASTAVPRVHTVFATTDLGEWTRVTFSQGSEPHVSGLVSGRTLLIVESSGSGDAASGGRQLSTWVVRLD